MSIKFHTWLNALRERRERWVNANHENNFDRGIWNATVEKYADPSHFIFELLQNAEDAGATKVRFELQSDKIIFEHDGRPFDRDDIEGITGIGNTTKLDDGHKIGCFGIGFKSVYVVTERPEVHTSIEGEPLAFAIEDLVVPKLIPARHNNHATQIVLPLRADRAALTLGRARIGLAASGARSLLFLSNIKHLDWIDGTAGGKAEVTDAEGSVRSVRSTWPDGTLIEDRLTQSVENRKDRKQYEVKAALRMNGGGDLVAEDTPTRLRVFFETEEPTGLHFTIHGPFQLTDNRGNIKRDDPWNTQLVNVIGKMVADALPDLRDRGLLKRSALDLLPNESDELPQAFAPIRSAIVAKFAAEPLIPAHSGGYVTTKVAIRGPADLRDLLREDGLYEFANTANRQWITAGLRNSRADAFLNTLKIDDWNYGEFFSAFLHVFGSAALFLRDDDWRKRGLAWFNRQTNEQLQHFYLALDTAHKAQKRAVSITNFQFVRLEDNCRHSPHFAKLAPVDSELDPEAEKCDLFLVKKSLVRLGRGRGKEVEQFLRRVGVSDVDERAYLSAIIRSQYKDGGTPPNRERHLQHMRRFLRWWKKHDDIGMFADLKFVRAGDGAAYHNPDEIYFGTPFLESALSQIYGGSIDGRDRISALGGVQGAAAQGFDGVPGRLRRRN